MDKTADKLVKFALSLEYDDIPSAAIRAAKGRIVDSMGCAMAGFDAPTVKASRRMAVPVADGPTARVFGTLTRTTPDLAALVNGAMIRYLDMSDAYLMTSTAHPSDNLGALIAVAEATGASGRDLLLATILSYEVQCRLCDAAPFQRRGWDQPVAGAPGAAMAVGRLMGLTKEQMHQALALAVVPNIAINQTRKGELSMWKGMAGPNAARQGTFAAYLAQAGMTGPDEPFDGVCGVWAQTMGEPRPVKLTRKGGKYALVQTNIKIFPVRDSNQVPILAALELREMVDVNDIQSLRIDTYATHFAEAMKDAASWVPQTRETADHSLPFCIAAALLDGDVTPETFVRDRFLDKDARDLMKRMNYELVDAFDRNAPATRTCRLVATMKDGRNFIARKRQTPKDIERGPSDAEFEAKFHKLAARTLDERARAAMLELIWNIDEAERIDALIDLTAVSRQGA